MQKTIDYLKAHAYGEPGAWKKQAQTDLAEWDWKQYSFQIAIKARSAMAQKGITQKQLAEAMGCTQQYVSQILKGNLNLTLETISKLEKALGFDIIGQALLAPAEQYRISPQAPVYLNDPGPEDRAVPVKTSSLVDGYPVRKKKGPKKNKGV